MPVDSGNPPFYLSDDGIYGIRWTLNYEIYFYIIIGCFILIKNDWKLIMAYFFVTVSLFPFFMGYDFTFSKKGIDSCFPYLNLVTNPIIYVFLLGYILGVHYERVMKIHKIIRVIFLIMSCFVFYWGVFRLHMIRFDLSSSGWLLGILFYGIVINEGWIKVLIPPWLLYVGESSLSLYLIHTLFNHSFRWILDGTFIHNKFISFGLCCALSIFFAMLSFRFIEKPFYYKKKTMATRDNTRV
ncbi:acyltransferase family protein [Rahnella aquatilis CIP 78.65 = ATCC 33071]|nr:acyltransferase family protein [Rahnella aquatilis CIP 78.65 = ATCC 33071]